MKYRNAIKQNYRRELAAHLERDSMRTASAQAKRNLMSGRPVEIVKPKKKLKKPRMQQVEPTAPAQEYFEVAHVDTENREIIIQAAPVRWGYSTNSYVDWGTYQEYINLAASLWSEPKVETKKIKRNLPDWF